VVAAVLVAAVPVCAAAVGASQAAVLPGPACLPGEATIPLTADARISANHPGRNYGTGSRWKVNFGPGTARSFINFELPEISDACIVTKATVSLRGSQSGRPHPATADPGANINFYLATRDWREGGITWDNQPRGHGCYGIDPEYATTDEWDITGIIDDAYRCLRAGRLDAWHGLKLRGWSPKGHHAHWRIGIDSRESDHPPVVHLSWE
jgi:hypothetical protein